MELKEKMTVSGVTCIKCKKDMKKEFDGKNFKRFVCSCGDQIYAIWARVLVHVYGVEREDDG